MRSLVLFIVFIVSTAKYKCASIGSCTTSTGLQGQCLLIDECATTDLSSLSKELCGYNNAGVKFYCCVQEPPKLDNFRGSLNSSAAQQSVIPQVNNVSNSIAQAPIQETAKQASFSISSPSIANSASVSSSSATNNISRESQQNNNTSSDETRNNFARDATNACITPNGEQAQCISIYSCAVFIRSLASTVPEDQKMFLRESRCGSTNSSVLVCCGSDVRYKVSSSALNVETASFNRNSLIPDECGIQFSSRIFGGRDADSFDFPWTALLEFEREDSSKQFLCSGTLISPRYVLTAAHCIINRNSRMVNVRLGEWNINSTDQGCNNADDLQSCNPLKLNVGIEATIPHPNYTQAAKNNDIGLIRLNRNVNYNDLVRPICLPGANSYIFPGERLTVSGWGLKNYQQYVTTKQKVELPVIATSECIGLYRDRISIGKGQFCAGGEAGKDSCVGDSGAPLMRMSNSETGSRWSIEGIVSFGFGCGLEGRFGVYTKVSEYLGWIHNTITI